MRKILAALLIAGSLSACTTVGGYNGAAVGGAAGALGGAVIDRHNPWRGGVIGGLIGGAVGAAIGENADRDAYERGRYDGRYEEYRYRQPRRPRYYDDCGCYRR